MDELKELMECLENRPQTWKERRRQLGDQGRAGEYLSDGTELYPRLLGLFPVEEEPIFWKAKGMVDVPLVVSEERYPDEPDTMFLYWTAASGDASEFWRVYDHLTGRVWHKCDARCTARQLPEFHGKSLFKS